MGQTVPDACRPEPRWVADGSTLAQVCAAAAAARRVAVDTEADSFHSYFHKLCLVQLSFDGRDVLVDPVTIGREGMEPFVRLCGDPRVVKVMHGADYDLRVLHRDLGVRMQGLRDSQRAAELLGEPRTGLAALLAKELGVMVDKEHQRAAELLGEPRTGLAALLAKELGVMVDKEHQRADFGTRPLPVELRRYAAGDTAHLCALLDILQGRLEALGRVSWWLEECRLLETVEWRAAQETVAPFERIPGAGKLRGARRDRLAALAAWREQLSAAKDVPPFRIMHNDTLLRLAEDPPETLEALAARKGVGQALVRRFGHEILALLAAPPPAPARPPRSPRVVDRERERRVAMVKAIRDTVAAELGIAAALLAPRAVVEAIVDEKVVDVQGLRACLGREWRTEVLAPRLVALLGLLHGAEGGSRAAPE